MKKLYYSISEISQITGLRKYVIRFWETEFSNLKPKKNKAGNRIYKKKDLDLINKIKDLLYNQNYTIKGAKKVLKQKSDKSYNKIIKNNNQSNDEYAKVLNDLKSKIQNILDQIRMID